MTAGNNKDIMFMILQFLGEEKYKESLHTLQRESGVYFDMKHFEDIVTNGDLDEALKYLSGFTKVDDNAYSTKTFFVLQRQKYLEALDRKDMADAVVILKEDLKAFATKYEALYKDMAMLLTLTNLRENKDLKAYDSKLQRAQMLLELKELIDANPLLQDRLQFPSCMNSILRTLIDQGFKGQHHVDNPNPDTATKNLFVQPNLGPKAPYILAHHVAGSKPNSRALMGTHVQAPAHFTSPLTRNVGNSRPQPWKTSPSISCSQPWLPSLGPIGLHLTSFNKPATVGSKFSKKEDRQADVSYKIGHNQNHPDLNLNNERHVWKPAEISRPSELRSLRLPDLTLASKIMKLMYTHGGSALLALSYNAIHKLWKWQGELPIADRKASAKVEPLLWTPSSGILMTNEISEANPEEAVSCFDVSKNNSYVISASGGKISLYYMFSFKTILTFKPPPPAATFLAFHPKDNNIIAIGMDDSTIHIYDIPKEELISKLEGHQKRITGLAFSNVLDILVSSDADSLLCVWGINGWEKRTNTFLQKPTGGASNFHTRVQFHKDQSSLLAVHENKVAVYEAPEMKNMKQWFPPQEFITSEITDATYSSDSESIFLSFKVGKVAVLISKTLQLKCLINPSAYLSSDPSSGVYPVALAAHPSETNQFALGLTDGGVYVLEPLESDPEWGTRPSKK